MELVAFEQVINHVSLFHRPEYHNFASQQRLMLLAEGE
jgi:hypothetical protein